jgi:hypothetical protein
MLKFIIYSLLLIFSFSACTNHNKELQAQTKEQLKQQRINDAVKNSDKMTEELNKELK